MPTRTRIKVCGLTRIEDVEAAAANGTDAIGLVFYPKSPRYVTVTAARALRQALPPFVDVVALFVNAGRDDVQQVIAEVKPEFLQFHGDESPEFCDSFAHRYLRAFRVGGPGLETPEAVLSECRRYSSAAGWLFDSYSSGYGGSGLSFDPELLSEVSMASDRRPIVLAGGLRAETVHATIEQVRPYAVDVSSGVEESPGVKSAQKIARFISAVHGNSK